jgi:hypothetical protein
MGGCLGRGWWWRESKESKESPNRPECIKMAKNWQFSALIDLKLPIMQFFT